MKYCHAIFVLDNGKELVGDDADKAKELFPFGIIDKLRPNYNKALADTKENYYSIFRIYQNGEFKIEPDLEGIFPFDDYHNGVFDSSEK